MNDINARDERKQCKNEVLLWFLFAFNTITAQGDMRSLGTTKDLDHSGGSMEQRKSSLYHQPSSLAEEKGKRQLYNPYWPIGELDPVRNRKWPVLDPGQNKLEHVPVEPSYMAYIIEGDRHDSGQYQYFEPRHEADGSLQIGNLGGFGPLMSNKRVTLFIDFGRVIPGTLEIGANVPSGTEVSFETGEALLRKQNYKVDKDPDGSRQKFRPYIEHAGWGGMRYAWVHFENLDKPFTVFKVDGIYQVRPSNYVGSFECSDEMLARIWEMCAYSAHAVMGQPVGNDPTPKPVLQTLIMDRVDRHPWAGDSRVIQTAVEYVFGEYDLIRHANESFIPIGTRPIPHMQSIPPYTVDWALAVIDYYRVSGDAGHMKKRVDDLLVLMKDFDPSPDVPKGTYFFDWDKRIGLKISDQNRAAYWGKYIQMCRESAWACKQVGSAKAAKKFELRADRLADQWRKGHPDWQKQYDIHAITNLLLGGVLDSEDYQTAYDAVYADRISRCTNTPYFGIYVVQALARIGKYESAVQMLRDYWGTMIQAGATTTWEEWDPASRLPVNAMPPQLGPPNTWAGLSLCQPAGSGPAHWLIKEVIGIAPAEPGFRRIRIEPRPIDLQWARGSAASPLGVVKVEWKIENDRFIMNFSVPTRSEGANVFLPSAKTYKMDGITVRPDYIENGKAVFLTKSGKHSIVSRN